MEYTVKHREIFSMKPIKVTEESTSWIKHTQFRLFCCHQEPFFTITVNIVCINMTICDLEIFITKLAFGFSTLCKI